MKSVKVNPKSLAYRVYHEAVMLHIERELCRRWPPTTPDEARALQASIAFFDSCTYDEEFLGGEEPADTAVGNIEAAAS